MKLPFVLRLEPRPHIQPLAPCGRPFAYTCRGRGVETFAATPEMAWALWFNDVFEGSPHALKVLQLAEESDKRRIAAMAVQPTERALGAAAFGYVHLPDYADVRSRRARQLLDSVHLAVPGDHP